MFIDMSKIGKLRVKYNQVEDCEFLGSPQDYVEIAKRTISSYGGVFIGEMLRSEDILSNIATHIMYGDWRWNAERSNGGVRESYRIECAKWAIKKYISRRKQGKPPMMSIDNECATMDGDRISYAAFVPDPKNHVEEIENNELINMVMKSSVLSTKERTYIQEYYVDRKTYQEIAEENNTSRQHIHQVVKSGVQKLREVYCEY